MAQVTVYTDPHLGLKRKANFTPTSAALRESEALTSLEAFVKGKEYVLCAGDFFDKPSNSEDVIFSTFEIAKHTTAILAGNHDIQNNVESVSSLQLINEVCDNVLFQEDLSNPTPVSLEIEGWKFYFVPHVLSQADFEKCLDLASEDALGSKAILILHCNYDTPHVSEVDLTLSAGKAKALLEVFHEIWIGHEHNQKEAFDGRLKIIGSWRPTAFDNLGNKRVLLFDTETGMTTSQLVWESVDHVYEGPASHIVNDDKIGQYYDIIDDLPKGDVQKLIVKLMKSGAFGVRVRRELDEEMVSPVAFASIDNLPSLILEDLKTNRPDLVSTYQELINDY